MVSSAAASAQIAGQATVTDGDSLQVSGHRIRLFGIDAPESRQTCVAGRPVACAERDRDRSGRIVAVCRVDGHDINAWMVSRGMAVAYRKDSRAYVAQERSAKAARRGLWRGDFIAPWDWRRGKRLAAAASSTRSGDCGIKGNISRKGTRIYHVPGGQFHARTRIDTSRGERWFCSQAESRAAGWRRAKR